MGPHSTAALEAFHTQPYTRVDSSTVIILIYDYKDELSTRGPLVSTLFNLCGLPSRYVWILDVDQFSKHPGLAWNCQTVLQLYSTLLGFSILFYCSTF